ncbi:MAG TPA: N-acetyltransferase [Candidatus Hydrogenedentes bacterium]|nr:N-acetyltransferase [Candidatus Hydrogenedentota bacterium]HQH54710.1 N-acetyltransferase [Candidatus Hydrogenedentota bacterium]HQM47538.1 N-acetyltransferase [Candidatus Hydrogenedentota bacterium]
MHASDAKCLKGVDAVAGVIRKARLGDMAGVKVLIDAAVVDDAVLPRTLIELCENVRDFHVYEEDGQLLGCCALHVDMQNLAEVRSLVVHESRRGSGIGSAMLRACLGEAGALGVERVYALTRSPKFFEREGFGYIDKHELPSKVFRDCVRCPRFPDCDELAVIRTVAG